MTDIAFVVMAAKGDATSQTFAHNAPECPPIDGICVVIALDDFWREVFLSADKRVGAVPGQFATTIRAKAPAGVRRRRSLALDVVRRELDGDRITTVSKGL